MTLYFGSNPAIITSDNTQVVNNYKKLKKASKQNDDAAVQKIFQKLVNNGTFIGPVNNGR